MEKKLSEFAVGEKGVIKTVSGDGSFFLAEIPVFEDIFSMEEIPAEYRHELSSASFTVSIDRIAEYDGVKYDRLLSKLLKK